MVSLTPHAAEVLARSDAAARRFNPRARVRLSAGVAPELRTELVEEPGEGDAVIALTDVAEIYVDGGLRGLIDAGEPHDRLVLGPPVAPDVA
jgi:hypothetical protein